MAQKVRPPKTIEEQRARRVENRFDVVLIILVVGFVAWIAAT